MTATVTQEKIDQYLAIFDQAEKMTFKDDQEGLEKLSRKTLQDHFEAKKDETPDLLCAVIEQWIITKTTENKKRTQFTLGKQNWLLDFVKDVLKNNFNLPSRIKKIDAIFSEMLRTDNDEQIDDVLDGYAVMFPRLAVLGKYQELVASTDTPRKKTENKIREARYSYVVHEKIMERAQKILKKHASGDASLVEKGIRLVASSMGSQHYSGCDGVLKSLPEKETEACIQSFAKNMQEITDPELYTLVYAWNNNFPVNSNLMTRHQCALPTVVKHFALDEKVSPIREALTNI